jgi:hypothetical protein
MATLLLPILNTHTLPDAIGEARLEVSGIDLNANDRYNHFVFAFVSQSARRGITGKWRVPENYVGTPKLEIEWVTTATSGDCVWDVDYTAIADGESYDPSADQQSASVTDTAAGTARLLNRATITLTAANFAVGDEVQFGLFRDAADAADTLAATAWLVGAYFSFTDA